MLSDNIELESDTGIDPVMSSIGKRSGLFSLQAKFFNGSLSEIESGNRCSPQKWAQEDIKQYSMFDVGCSMFDVQCFYYSDRLKSLILGNLGIFKF